MIDYNLIYQLIEFEWNEILLSSKELVIEVTNLCQDISLKLFQKYFSRFTAVLDLLQDQTRE